MTKFIIGVIIIVIGWTSSASACQILDERAKIPAKLNRKYSVFKGKFVGFTRSKSSFPFSWRYNGNATGIRIRIDTVLYSSAKLPEIVEVYKIGVSFPGCVNVGVDTAYYRDTMHLGDKVCVSAFRSNRVRRFGFLKGLEVAALYSPGQRDQLVSGNAFRNFEFIAKLTSLSNDTLKAAFILENARLLKEIWGENAKELAHGVIFMNMGLTDLAKVTADSTDNAMNNQ